MCGPPKDWLKRGCWGKCRTSKSGCCRSYRTTLDKTDPRELDVTEFTERRQREPATDPSPESSEPPICPNGETDICKEHAQASPENDDSHSSERFCE